MSKIRLWAALALASAPPLLAADVTEEQFLAAGAGHSALRALDDDLARAEAARRAAGQLANPRLEFWRERPDERTRLTNWTLAWTPPLDGRFGLGKRAAEAGLAATREEASLARAAVRAEQRRVFADWSLAAARAEVAAAALARIAALAEQERQRARAGEESGLSARRLGLAEAAARADLGAAQAALALAAAEARAWQPTLAAEARPELPPLPVPPAAADGELPRARAAEHRLEQSRLESRLEGRFWGFPTLQAGVQRLEENGIVRSEPLLAASWSLPLFDRRQAARAEARRRADAAAARFEHVQATARAEVEGGRAAYEALRVAALDAEAAAAGTPRVIEAASAAWRAGESGLTDLLDALRAAFDAQQRALDARGAALAAHRRLEAAFGQPLPSPGGNR